MIYIVRLNLSTILVAVGILRRHLDTELEDSMLPWAFPTPVRLSLCFQFQNRILWVCAFVCVHVCFSVCVSVNLGFQFLLYKTVCP